MPNDHEDAELDNGGLKIEDIDPEAATPEQVEQLKKTAQTALAQRGKWKDRAIDPSTGKPYKDLLAEAKAKPEPPAQPPVPPAPSGVDELRKEVDGLKLSDQKRHIGYRHTLSPEETDLAFQMAGNDPAKTEELLDPKNDSPAAKLFRGGLERLRTENSVSANTPGPSNRSPMVEGKTFGQMTEKERAENFDKVKGGLAKK